MRVRIKRPDKIDPINFIKARTMSRRLRTTVVNCTHIDMDRVYGRDQQCFVCGRAPDLGFLYECRQDCEKPSLRDAIGEDGTESTSPKSILRARLENVGLSESVIITAEQGHYTPGQLALLEAQKLDLRQTILDTQQQNEANEAAALLANLSKPASDEADHSLASPSSNCTFKACQSCRPYYRDRVPISFESVLNSDFSPVTWDEVEQLPIKSASIMRDIGSIVPPGTSSISSPLSPTTMLSSSVGSSDFTFSTTSSNMDDDCTPTSAYRHLSSISRRSSSDIARTLNLVSGVFTRQGLRSVVQGFFQIGSKKSHSSTSSNITLPLARTGTIRDINDPEAVKDFDLGALERVREEKERVDKENRSSDDTTVDGLPIAMEVMSSSCAHAHTENENEDPRRTSTSKSDSGSSVYTFASGGTVVGGVALTEEAAETHTLDVLAVEMDADKPGLTAVCRELPEHEDHADMGFQSIMTQV